MEKQITQEQLEKLRSRFPTGAKVRLVRMDDTQAPPTGTVGEVLSVDDIGTVHVQWSTGSTLGAVYGEDKIEVLDPVVTVSYGQERKWDDRRDAIAFFVDCMLGSEGAEQERYLKIYLDLMTGKKVCKDEN